MTTSLMKSNISGERSNPLAKILIIYYIIPHNLSYSVRNVVHRLNPSHHIVCFELFGNTLLLFELLYKAVIHLGCSDINIV